MDKHASFSLFAVLFLASAFLAGAVQIVSVPSGARTYLDGEYIGNTPLENLNIAVGSHMLLLTKESYRNLSQRLDIQPNHNYALYLRLTPANRNVVFTISSNPSGADAYIDGRFVGRTNMTINVTEGMHNITIRHDGYYDFSRISEARYPRGGAQVTLRQVDRTNGTLNVTTDPGGAEVYVDNVRRGPLTPNSLSIAPRNHQISIRKEGYQDYNANIYVRARTLQTLNATLQRIQQENITSNLTLYSDPYRTNVWMTGPNGTMQFVTPRALVNLNPGLYSFNFSSEGYYDNRTNLTIGEYQNSVFNATLQRIQQENITSNLTLFSNPNGANVRMTGPNGTMQFTTPRALVNLNPGLYSFNFSSEGYYDNRTNLTIGEYQNLVVNATLQRREQRTGNLTVYSVPLGATFMTLGPEGAIYDGMTPGLLTDLPPGFYYTNFSLVNYSQANMTAYVNEGQNRVINATLERIQQENITSNLTLFSNPNGANVRMTGPNGTMQFTTPRALVNLNPGLYSFNFSMQNYSDNRTNLTIGEYQNSVFNATLERR